MKLSAMKNKTGYRGVSISKFSLHGRCIPNSRVAACSQIKLLATLATIPNILLSNEKVACKCIVTA